MDRTEKLRLSLSFETGHAFRQGMFMRLYEASLCWFSHHAKPLKIMVETTKQGERLLYGGLPIASFNALLLKNALPESHATEYGHCWHCEGSSIESVYQGWREECLENSRTTQHARVDGRRQEEIIARIRAFELSSATPMQAMNAVAAWQEMLRVPGKEGAQ